MGWVAMKRSVAKIILREPPDYEFWDDGTAAVVEGVYYELLANKVTARKAAELIYRLWEQASKEIGG